MHLVSAAVDTNRRTNGQAKDRYRRRRFCGISRRQSAQEDAGESTFDRPYESPPVSAAALPGGDISADIWSDSNSDPQHFSGPEEHHGGLRGGHGSRQSS